MKIIGHRGARGLAPENTAAGLQKALEIGVDEIEFDVRVTRDGVPVLYHDATILESNGDKYPLAHYDYSELKKHKPDLATLKEALGIVAGAVPLYIEVKQGVDIQSVVKVLRAYKHSYLLGSKSQRTLTQLHQELPDVPKIVIEAWSGVRATHRAKQVNTKILAMYQLFLWSGFIRAMKRGGYELYAYTINDPAKARRWAKHGLAGVVTDYPDRFKN
jgi:glycerophosphoryl diester phosphodiesterase